jgi:hypothetical protein
MTRGGSRWWVPSLSLTLTLASVGCAARPPRPMPIAVGAPEPIGVVSGPFVSQLVLQPPPAGGGAGAARGAGAGFAGALGSGNLLLLLGAPIMATITAAEGAITARPAAEVERAEATLKRAFADLPLHADLRERVVRLAAARTGRMLVSVPEAGPTGAGGQPDYRDLASRGLRTVVEVSLPAVGFRPAGPSVGNPGLQLLVVARLRVVSLADGREIARRDRTYQGGTYKFTQWAERDAERFRTEIDRAIDQLAWTAVTALFCVDGSAAACGS